MTELVVLGGISYLLLYMYFAVNLLMLVLEKKIKLSIYEPSQSLQKIVALTSRAQSPTDYLKARIYLWGTIVTLLGSFFVIHFIP